MVSRPNGVFLAWLLGLVWLIPPSAFATIEWTFTPSCSAPPCANDTGGFKTFLGADASGSGAGPSVVTSGWGSTAGNLGVGKTTLEMGTVTQSDTGLGVVNADSFTYSSRVGGSTNTDFSGEGEPWGGFANSLDNAGRTDLILFEFCVTPTDGTAPESGTCTPEEITLNEISIWQSSTTYPWENGFDVSILAYTGSGAPDLTGLEYFSNPSGSSENLTENGWELVGNYDIGSGAQTITTDGTSSSHWLVTPYNPALCTDVTLDCKPDSLDYLQVTGLKGTGGSGGTQPQPAILTAGAAVTAVPAPSTLFLLAVGVPLIGRLFYSSASKAG